MKTLVSAFFIFLFVGQTACIDNLNKGTPLPPELPAIKIQGVVNGGGGKGVRCGNTVRLLDLYEGELKGYPTPVNSGSFNDNLDRIISKISEQMTMPGDSTAGIDSQKAFFKNMITHIIDIPDGQQLEFTNDATLPILPFGCQFVQIAINAVGDIEHENSLIKVYRDRSLWNMMPVIDQVALLGHEYVFFLNRLFSDFPLKSDDTRVLISKMFSGFETYPTYSPIWNVHPIFICAFTKDNDNSESHTFLMAKEEKNGIVGTGFYFSTIKQVIQISRTYAFIPNFIPEDFMKEKGHIQIYSFLENKLLDRKWIFEIQKTSPDERIQFRLTKEGLSFSNFSDWSSCGEYKSGRHL